MEHQKRCKSRKKSKNKVLRFELLGDTHGDYIPYCSYQRHPGIVYNGQHRKCEKQKCYYYIRFRPPTKLKKRCHSITIRTLEDLNKSMLR